VKQVWLIIAGVCILGAAALMLQRDFTTAFVVAVVGVVAWFLNYRQQIKSTSALKTEEDSELDEKDE
jgi:hypothetical protein